LSALERGPRRHHSRRGTLGPAFCTDSPCSTSTATPSGHRALARNEDCVPPRTTPANHHPDAAIEGSMSNPVGTSRWAPPIHRLSCRHHRLGSAQIWPRWRGFLHQRLPKTKGRWARQL